MPRLDRSALNRLAKETGEQTVINLKDAAEKRLNKKSAPIKTTPEFSDVENTRQEGDEVINWYSVRKWFKNGTDELMPGVFISQSWEAKEVMAAKRLLSEYPPELVERAVAYMCEQWRGMVAMSGGKLSGHPSVVLLWAMRHKIMTDCQLGTMFPTKVHRKHDVGEYDANTKSPGIGWSSDL